MFKDDRTNIHDEERSGELVILLRVLTKKNCERWRFTISERSYEFLQISRTLFHEIIKIRLGYHHKFRGRWVPKMLAGAPKT
jgi:hypothetical protein